MKPIVFVDVEVSEKNIVKDFGAIDDRGNQYHENSSIKFEEFVSKAYYFCGHNIIKHDSKYIEKYISNKKYKYIDTLYISPLIYPKQKIHSLVKDDKLLSDSVNNPLNDSIKAKELFYKEVSEFNNLPKEVRNILGSILYKIDEFEGFFDWVKWNRSWNIKKEIISYFEGKICENANIDRLISKHPIELAYVLSLISSDEKYEIVSPWVQINFPSIDVVIKELRGNSCNECDYCKKKFDPVLRLQEIFGYKEFRKYGENNEPLQEKAVKAALNGESILTIFPTGGGKSITFQLPALIAGEATKGLTVVISPLQSLMKDQVDGLEKKNIIDAVTINGMLDPVSRKEAIERVRDGGASLLYISPELLRSRTIENILLSRKIERIVIDEAHCFSAWGQDFRVDYLYIGKFINELQIKKGNDCKIPISCFTATAKQKVISDIVDYFKETLNINLTKIATTATRKNLHYKVEFKGSDDEKYQSLRELLKDRDCSTIIYASRTKEAERLAEKLCLDGFNALYYHGKLDSQTKIDNQNKFINDDVQIMVATSAFGMGVDKSDVKLVVHYEISDSLENYIQEAGRAGRDQSLDAECIVFYNENDLDKHFLLLNQSKLGINDVQKVWRGIKALSGKRTVFSCSPLELARASGWEQELDGIETTIKAAVNALEVAGYVKRGLNSPRIFATSINAKNTEEARKKIQASNLFTPEEVNTAVVIISKLIGKKSRSKNAVDEAESRVDYLADVLGLDRLLVINLIDKMKQIGILKDEEDMTAIIKFEKNKLDLELERYASLERFLLKNITNDRSIYDLKALNDLAIKENIKKPSVKNIKTLLLYWTINKYIKKTLKTSEKSYEIEFLKNKEIIEKDLEKRIDLASYIINYLYKESKKSNSEYVNFSMAHLVNSYNEEPINIFSADNKCKYEDVQAAIIYLTKLSVLSIEGGFLVLYNAMQIERLEKDNKIKYKKEDYKQLSEHYKIKVEQIHMVGEYANMMVNDYDAAMLYVKDYFELEHDAFIKKYFKNKKFKNITQSKYEKLFGELSEQQKKIIEDDENQYIAVIAGPGSGKTKVLVHKLASLLLLEDIKSEQLMMLTFSRAAAVEFKERLLGLIGATAHNVDIKTFHSYCFDLLGQLGDETLFQKVIPLATEMIENGEVEAAKITKSVLVIDEAQDMDENEYKLVQVLIKHNPDMRVIAVGDDDQSIYEFRDANSKYLKELILEQKNSIQYELIENYRSVKKVVDFSNRFAIEIKDRLKKNPILSVRKDSGNVMIIEHSSENIEEAVVKHVMKNKSNNKKIAILTQKNEEGLRVLSLLTKHNVSAKLIQNENEFNLYNLVELRFFIDVINGKSPSNPIITDFEWDYAYKILLENFSNSEVIDLVKRLIERYSNITKTRYKTDFINYVKESNLEDFIDYENSSIIISTIHKAKGHEFDSVYLLLNKPYLSSNEEKRKLYVGMTRAKDNLYIHCNNSKFAKMKNFANYYFDNREYNESEEVIIDLTHRDVRLGDFKYSSKKNFILNLRAGSVLNCKDDFLYVNNPEKPLFHYSNDFYNNKLLPLYEKGYSNPLVKIRYQVFWKDKNSQDPNEEWIIILPTIYMKKAVFVNEIDCIVNGDTIEEVEEKENNVEEIEETNFENKFDKLLYNKLAKLRIAMAKEEDIPIYYIFNNKELESICSSCPKTEEEFARIKGVGEYKLKKYAPKFIDVIKEHLTNEDTINGLISKKCFEIDKINKQYITHITDEINEQLQKNGVAYNFKYNDLRDFFEKNGLIVKEGKDYNSTTKGKEYGIESKEMHSERGTYTRLLYGELARNFLLDNLYEIYLSLENKS